MNVTGPKILGDKETLKKIRKYPQSGTPPTRCHNCTDHGHTGKLANHSSAKDSIQSSRKCA